LSKLPTCTGTGLLALDVILNGNPETPPKFQAGGSCGNVLTILSFLGWSSYPIARLANNKASAELLKDLKEWNVNADLIATKTEGSTPIIIHRILKDKNGNPKHKFEFKDPHSGEWLPRYKPVLVKDVEEISQKQPTANVFYFDRVNRASLELAKFNKRNGAIVIFEPSSAKDDKLFKEALDIAHILKFSKDRINNYEELFPTQQTVLEIETLGKDGLRYRFDVAKSAKKWKSIDSSKIDDSIIKDSAGAGDWCTAGIISQLCSKDFESFINMETSDIENALEYGQALGAINCCFDGARGIMYNISRFLLDKAVISLRQNNNLIDTIFEPSLSRKVVAYKFLSVASLF
jgi:sugar/nucleoside kinase (ribokinase family)